MAAAGQEHRRVPPPARRPLDPPAGDLPKLPRPRLQLAVPLARDAKVRRGEDPAARDRRPSRSTSACADRPRPRCPHDRASSAGATVPDRASFALLIACLDLQAYVVDGGPADNIPVDALTAGERSYQVRPILEGKNRGRHFVSKTPSPESDRFRVRPRFSLRPYANRRPRGHQRFNTGIAFTIHTVPKRTSALWRQRASQTARAHVPAGAGDPNGRRRRRSVEKHSVGRASGCALGSRLAQSSGQQLSAVQFSRNSITSPANSLGRSTQGKWPTSSITSRRAFAMPSATSRHASGPRMKSSCPATTSVGAVTLASAGRRSNVRNSRSLK